MEMSIDGRLVMRKLGKLILHFISKFSVDATFSKNFFAKDCANFREAIKEDDDGLVDKSVADIIQKAKRKRMLEKKSNARLGMMRHLYVIIDLSDCMSDQDLKPTRQICTLKVCPRKSTKSKIFESL
jgi:hypothetical protein